MNMSLIIREKLSSIEPSMLNIIDQSAKHKGHMGSREGGESHFDIEIISKSFSGKSMIDRHKMIYKLLENELKTQIHALSIKALTEEEYESVV